MRALDLTGQRFGRLVALRPLVLKDGRTYANGRTYTKRCWVCHCDCGNDVVLPTFQLTNDDSKSCGCLGRELREERHRLTDLVGKRFGKLTVVERCPGGHRGQRRRYICRCDCGGQTEAVARRLLMGTRLHCGCEQPRRDKESGKKRRSAVREATIHAVMSQYKHGATARNIRFILSEREFENLIFSDCHYCGATPLRHLPRLSYRESVPFNGIDRIVSSLPYQLGNVLPCCARCNLMKNRLGYDEFIGAALAIAFRHMRLQTVEERHTIEPMARFGTPDFPYDDLTDEQFAALSAPPASGWLNRRGG